MWWVQVELGPMEFLKEVSGTHGGTYLFDLKLVTSLRTIQAIGGDYNVGTAFSFTVPPNNRIVGFFGGKTDTNYSFDGFGVYTVEILPSKHELFSYNFVAIFYQ